MKTLKSSLVAIITWMALPVFGAAIETVSESFVGSAAVIPGVQGAGERVSLFSLRAVRPALYAGKVTAVSSTTITDAGANWTSTQFTGRDALYAEFANGVEADVQQVNVSAKKISFPGALPPSVTTGVAYRIREHHTVAQLFGNADQAGLLQGANATEAEGILHFIPETQETRTYFYLNLSGFNGWIQLDYSPASNVVIYPEQGLMVRRTTPGNITLTSTGPIKPGPATIPLLPGYNLLGLYNRASALSLNNLNLIGNGFVLGENPDVADNVLKFNPDNTTITYFYLNLLGFEGWYDYSFQPAGNVTLLPGSVFMVYRRPSSPILNWTVPSQ